MRSSSLLCLSITSPLDGIDWVLSRIYDVPGDHARLFINPTAQSIIQEVLEDAQRRVAAAPSSKFQEIARGDVDPR